MEVCTVELGEAGRIGSNCGLLSFIYPKSVLAKIALWTWPRAQQIGGQKWKNHGADERRSFSTQPQCCYCKHILIMYATCFSVRAVLRSALTTAQKSISLFDWSKCAPLRTPLRWNLCEVACPTIMCVCVCRMGILRTSSTVFLSFCSAGRRCDMQ